MILLSWVHFPFLLFFVVFKFCNGQNDTTEKTECDKSLMFGLFAELFDAYQKQENLLMLLKKDARGQTCMFKCPEAPNLKVESRWPQTCAEAVQKRDPQGVYKLATPIFNVAPFHAHCIKDPRKEGPAWTVIFRRSSTRLNFKRNKSQSQNGFGSLYGDHFLGLNAIFAMTNFQQHELWIQLKNSTTTINIRYSNFIIDTEDNNYMLLSLGNFMADREIGNHLESHVGQIFYTTDNDSPHFCVMTNNIGWHIPKEKKKCFKCQLFGEPDKSNGIYWNGDEYEEAHMMIRPSIKS